MRRVIFLKFLAVSLICLCVSGTTLFFGVYKALKENKAYDALNMLKMIDNSIDYSKYISGIFSSLEPNDMGFLIISDSYGNTIAFTGDENIDISQTEGLNQNDTFSEYTINSNKYISIILNSESGYILKYIIPTVTTFECFKILSPAILLGIAAALIVSSFLAGRFMKSITKPLNEITDELEMIYNDKEPIEPKNYGYDEVNNIMVKINALAKKIRSNNRIRQEFFSNASHELKTPITSIQGYAELLESGMVADEQQKKEFLQRIKKETSNMTALINDILVISKLETKQIEVAYVPVNLKDVTEDIVSALKPLADKSGIAINTDCNDTIVMADPQRMHQLINNIITNAIKYNKEHGSVNIIITKVQQIIIIRVIDTGIGIPEKDQQRVFERFYRVDKGRSKKMGGTGLGLSIVKHIVQFYNGSINLTSDENGTDIKIRLPENKDVILS